MSGTFAVATVVKDEDPKYLAEWAAFHFIVGATSLFVLCNDDDAKEAHTALWPWIKEGKVLFDHQAGRPESKLYPWAFMRAHKVLRDEVDWIAFLDGDELLVPRQGESVPEILIPFESPNVGGLAVHWLLFNSGGLDVHPAGKLQIEAYQSRLPILGEVRSINKFKEIIKFSETIKSVIRPSAVVQSVGSHTWEYQKGFAAIDECRRVLPALAHRFTPAVHQKLAIHHYVTRSKADYARKIRRGWPQGGGRSIPDANRWQIWERYHVESVKDKRAATFADKVRTELARVGRSI